MTCMVYAIYIIYQIYILTLAINLEHRTKYAKVILFALLYFKLPQKFYIIL